MKMLQFVVICVLLSVASASVYLQFNLLFYPNIDTCFNLRVVETIALVEEAIPPKLYNLQELKMMRIAGTDPYMIPVSSNISNQAIVSFLWTATILNSYYTEPCCWSVSNITFVEDSNSFSVNSCIMGNPVYNCANGDTWLCTSANDISIISDSFRFLDDRIVLHENCSSSQVLIEHSGTSNLPCFEQPSILDPSSSSNNLASSDSSQVTAYTSSTQNMVEDSSMIISSTNPEMSPSTTMSNQMSTQDTNGNSGTIQQTQSIFTTMQLLPSVTMKVCPENGIWTQTVAGDNITLNNGCYSGTVNVTRMCDYNGNWSGVYCQASERFIKALQQIHASPLEGLNELMNLNLPSNDVSFSQYQFLIQSALDAQKDMNQFADENFIQVLLQVQLNLISIIQMDPNLSNNEQRRQIGAQILQSLDIFALTLIEPSNRTINISNDAIFLRTTETNIVPNNSITAINSGQNSINLPPVAFGKTITVPVRVGSFIYRNLSNLLPPSNNTNSIISPVISATTNCQTCPITDLQENVTIQLHIEMLPSNSDDTVSCVFFQFERSDNDSQVTGGDWNTSGCTTTINGSIVTCSCNHLTHFAILFSPGLEDVDPIHSEILGTIGLILVPISLLCMMIVILTYTLIRSLWSIRNYIHVMLCVSLSMAQLVFIIGVDKIKNEGACSAIAVLLQYLFLVSFMWMLMEGVVLYVTLVRVFIDNHKYYIIAFTLTSYLVPAVYLILVTPLGYLVNVDDIPGHTHYLYYVNDEIVACWLNYNTGYISAFIIPVCLIVVANIGFFIMAIVIMRKHFKKQDRKKLTANVKHWLKVSISLTLVMGITWIIGLLAYSKSLIAIAYFYTVFVAGQGILLFIILIILSQQVRAAYIKLFKQGVSPHSERLSKLLSSMTTTTSSMGSSGKRGNKNGAHGGIKLGTFGETNIDVSTGSSSTFTSGGIKLGTFGDTANNYYSTLTPSPLPPSPYSPIPHSPIPHSPIPHSPITHSPLP